MPDKSTTLTPETTSTQALTSVSTTEYSRSALDSSAISGVDEGLSGMTPSGTLPYNQASMLNGSTSPNVGISMHAYTCA